MLEFLNKKFKNVNFYIGLVFVALVVLLFTKVNHPAFGQAKAEITNRINIFSTLITATDEAGGSGIAWKNINHAYANDLSSTAGLSEFSQENSAFIYNNQTGADEANISSSSAPVLFTEPEPANPEIQPINPETLPANPEIPPADAETPPANPEIPPADTETPPADPEIPPSNIEIPPADVETPQVNSETPPADVETPPSNIETPPAEDSKPSGGEGIIINYFKEKINKIFSGIFDFKIAKADEGAVDNSSNEPQAEEKKIGKSLVFSDFSVPAGAISAAKITNLQLRLSLAATGRPGDHLLIEYSRGESWQSLYDLDLREEISNQSNGGYFLYGLPILESWDDFKNFKIKITYLDGGKSQDGKELFFDSLWLEADYAAGQVLGENEAAPETSNQIVIKEKEKISPEEKLGVIKNDKYNLSLISGSINFKIADQPKFDFQFKKNRGLLSGLSAQILDLFRDEYENIEIKAEVFNSNYEKQGGLAPVISYEKDGRFKVEFKGDLRKFKPGKYSALIKIRDGEEFISSIQDFTWGVLALNLNKSTYLPTETAYLQMGVLDDSGHTICDAGLYLEITAPDGGVAKLNTDNGLIARNPACGPNNVIDSPDYYAYYGLAGVGQYKIKLTAQTENGLKEITDEFEVRESLPFEIERIGPTRIYPMSPYQMKFRIKAGEDFKGIFTEYLPDSFVVVDSFGAKVNLEDNNISLSWPVQWRAGETYQYQYVFDAPDISPEFYLLGPAEINSEINSRNQAANPRFKEARQWQIASDSTGEYNGNAGSSVTWTNNTRAWDSTDETFASRDIPNGSADDSANYIQVTANTATDLGYAISKVEIGIEGYVENTTCSAMLLGRFSGATNGPVHRITGAIMGTTNTDDTTKYVDITFDAGAPSIWTWTNIMNLDVRVYGFNTGANNRFLYIDQIRIRVTYNVPPTVSSLVQYQSNGITVIPNGGWATTTGNVVLKTDVIDADTSEIVDTYFELVASSTAFSVSTGTIPFIISSTYGVPGASTFVVPAGVTSVTVKTWAAGAGGGGGDASAAGGNGGGGGYVEGTIAVSAGQTLNINVGAGGGAGPVGVSYGGGGGGGGGYSSVSRSGTYLFIAGAGGGGGGGDDSTAGPGGVGGAGGGATGAVGQTAGNAPGGGGGTQTAGGSGGNSVDDYDGANGGSMAGGTGGGEGYEVGGGTGGVTGGADGGGDSNNGNDMGGGGGGGAGYYGGGGGANTNDASPERAAGGGGGSSYVISTATATSTTAGNGVNTPNTSDSKYVSPAGAGGTGGAVSTIGNPGNSGLVVISYQTGTVVPCDSGTAYDSCASKIWKKTSPAGNYSSTPYTATTSITGIPVLSEGYKWQVVTCDDDNSCSAWSKYNLSTPNIKVDLTDPIAPGNLTQYAKATSTITLGFGIPGSDANFDRYRIYYKAGTSGVTEANTEWTDAHLNDVNYSGFSTTTVTGLTPNTDYVFNIWIYDKGGRKASSTEITIKTNSIPPSVSTLVQYQADGTTAIANGGWAATGTVVMKAQAIDSENPEVIKLYFQLVASSTAFATATSVPANPCDSGTAYNSCASKIWTKASSTSGNYTASAFIATSTATLIPTLAEGYKWQSLACDDGDKCSEWSGYNASTPNVKVDVTDPLAPGSLTQYAKATSTITLGFGAPGSDSNFVRYRIYYKAGTSGVTEGDTEKVDAHLLDVNYSNFSTTTVTGLTPSTDYVFNIWIYDIVGRKATSTEIMIRTNSIPPSVSTLVQYQADGTTVISNGGWAATGTVVMKAQATDPENPEVIKLYFQLVASSTSFTTATSVPANPCDSGTAYNSCASKIWTKASSTSGNYTVTAFIATSTATLIPTLAEGYKWQSLACDDGDKCSEWSGYNASTPNVKVDVTDPIAPGPLTQYAKATSTITLGFGAAGSDSNFVRYRIYYKAGTSGVTEANTEWTDAHLNDVNYSGFSTTTVTGLTASTDYVFNIWIYDIVGRKATSTEITIKTNSIPPSVSTLVQYQADGTTVISNGDWGVDGNVVLKAQATDPENPEVIKLYFQLIASSSSFTTATSVPANPCDSGTAYDSCASKIWTKASSTSGNYTASAFIATSTATLIPTLAEGYKWQSLACDDGDKCSEWSGYNASTPNVKVDVTDPIAPGNLIEYEKTENTITLEFGDPGSDTNFDHYKIYYKPGTSGVTEGDTEQIDGNLSDINYNGASYTTIEDLISNTDYVINIWIYDQLGHKASSTEISIRTVAGIHPPTSMFNSVSQKTDGSGVLDISMEVNDQDRNDARVKIDYEAGTACSSFSNRPTLDETDGNITADFGDPQIDNNSEYQIGTSTDWILTDSGSNTVNFDWDSKEDLPDVNGIYCLRIIANDNNEDQTTEATTTVMIDNFAPSTPGGLSLDSQGMYQVTLTLPDAVTESNFSEYKIFYKIGSSGVTEGDSSWTQAQDANLGDQYFNSATVTTITGLSDETEYVFNIWAYDAFGNKASSTQEISLVTNKVIANDTRYYLVPNSGTNVGADTTNAACGGALAAGTTALLSPTDSACGSVTRYTFTPALSDTYLGYFAVLNTAYSVDTFISGSANSTIIRVREMAAYTSWYFEFCEYDPGGAAKNCNSLGTSTSVTTGGTGVYTDLYPDTTGMAGGIIRAGYKLAVKLWQVEAGPTYGQARSYLDESSTPANVYISIKESTYDTAPETPASLEQFKINGVTAISNGSTHDENGVVLGASAIDADSNEIMNLYFQLVDNNSDFLTSTELLPPVIETYASPGADTFVVPAGVTSVTVKTWAAGAGGGGGDASAVGGNGGGGGYITGTIAVSAGQTLNINVGAGGGAGPVGVSYGGGGGGGGGYSSVSRSGTYLFIAGAGGGGGGGDDSTAGPGGVGGAGGGTSGVAGETTGNAPGGGAGTQTGGGAGGNSVNDYDGANGGSMAGGAGGGEGFSITTGGAGGATGGAAGGGDSNDGADMGGGGGGGAGYYGGGGGANTNDSSPERAAGGGGGSSYAISTATATSTTAGSGTATANTSDYDYISPAGVGAAGGAVSTIGNPGNSGLVVITYRLEIMTPCDSGTAYNSCASKIWKKTSPVGNYSSTPYTATTSIPSIPDSSEGYKWQVAVCDKEDVCSGWAKFNLSIPNFLIDTSPNNSTGLGQYKADGATVIANQAWTNENQVKLRASVTDPDSTETLTLFFEVASSTDGFTSATTSPCLPNTSWTGCASKIWAATSSPGDYRSSPFTGTVNPTGLFGSSDGYKWQVMACDSGNTCSNWIDFGADPNFKVDFSAPIAPDHLSFYSVGATSIILTLGNPGSDDNFDRYKIYYKVGTSGVTENDTEFNDDNFIDVDYNGAATTTISSLAANNHYVFNIWIYDKVGNKASSTPEISTTTLSSFTPPTGLFNSAAQKTDGSGAIDISIAADDFDNDDTLRAKLEYEAGSSCAFSPALDPYLDEADAKITALNGDPDVDNNSEYQVGTSTSWIITSPGINYVQFDWLSQTNIPSANGTYCLRLTVNDGAYSQDTPDTKLLIIDNIPPTLPGALTLNSKTATTLTLNLDLANPSSDTRFDKYRIFYATSSPASVNGVAHDDPDFGDADYNDAATTTITGLLENTTYYINIWAYDDLGNKASSTSQLIVKTNGLPYALSTDGQYKANGVTAVANGQWTDENQIKLTASAKDPDTSETVTLYFELLPDAGSFRTATSAPPTGACVYGTAYGDCLSKVWFAASLSPGDYSVTPFTDTVSITSIPESSTGYKWQLLSCDDSGDCANSWINFNAAHPNFKVDTADPVAPGDLTENTKNSNSITLNLGDPGSDTHFSEYKIFYSETSPVSEAGTEQIDSNLHNVTYNGAGTTLIDSLDPETTYYINIWIYDLAGKKASSTQVSVQTTSVSSPFNLTSLEQYRIDGVTTIANGDWTDDSVVLKASANDLTTSEYLTLYFELIDNDSTFSASTTDLSRTFVETFASPGADTFVVPAGVTSLTVKTWAAGAGGGGGDASAIGGNGGAGGYVTGTIAVTAGQTLNINVGAGGGGGPAGVTYGGGGGGGGYSSVSRSGTYLFIAGAGGGGGGGDDSTAGTGGDGGAGGGTTGVAGQTVGNAPGGGGGTPTAGGAGGNGPNYDGTNGGSMAGGGGGGEGFSITTGGAGGATGGANGGGDSNDGNDMGGGGGGGAGYYGGGGGANANDVAPQTAAGGGGGSSYVISTATATSTTAGSGVNTGNTSDISYVSPAGAGGGRGTINTIGSAGDNGLIVISYEAGSMVACNSGTAYDSCASKIWKKTSPIGNYSSTAYMATTSIVSLPEPEFGYKWQATACDYTGTCFEWVNFNDSIPNFKIDLTAPTPPGDLAVESKTSNSVTLHFGDPTDENNFSEYKIFYKAGASGVTELNNEHDDPDLDYIDYHTTSSTTVNNLSPSTQYVFNIWAYDLVGNKASSTVEIATTTNAAGLITQRSYLLENDDGANVNANTADVAVDNQLSDLNKGERLNARIQIDNTGDDDLNSKIYKLQFENQTDTPGTWTDVGAATQISYSLGISGANSAAITSSKATSSAKTWINGTWHENTGATGSYSLPKDKYTEFVFAIKTNFANSGKTYRLRLYNQTDTAELNGYDLYPTITTAAADARRYSKGVVASLGTNKNDLTYYFDPEGYSDISADDTNRDEIVSYAQIPVYNFAIKHTNNTDAMSAGWNGQSSVSTASKNAVLQVYRAGSTNAWVTVDTESATGANTDFDLTGSLNSSLSEYYDGSNWTYWRVYQVSGTQALRSDYFNISFSAPIPETSQIHYRWRDDNGSESAATWREAADTGDPTVGTALNKLVNARLRMSVTNTGGGDATNYNYRLEYASTTSNCATDPGSWVPVPVTATTEHFNMSTSTNFADGDATTKQFADAEGYTFTAGKMVEDPSNTTGNITVSENKYTEVEYVIQANNNASEGGTYCFRVTNGGSLLNHYNIFPELTLSGTANTAPVWTIKPTDHESSSETPTNYGSKVYFSATSTDPESDDYYLAICQTNAITAGNNLPPSCPGGNWCISSAASSTAGANCDYTVATSTQELAWYAFVCDKRAGSGVAKCSASSQGEWGTEEDSPFNVNNRPVFTSVSTTVNNKDPGGAFTITTVSSDTDSSGGADTLYLFVCRTNSATFSGCTGETVCSAAATSSPNAKCYYNDTAPTPSGAYTYYAFIFDSHQLAATGNSKNSTYTVNNVAPTLGSLFLNGGADISLNIKNAPDKVVQTINTSVVDPNGCATGLVSATAVIYMSNATGGENCSGSDPGGSDYNNCYKITAGNCVKSACTGDDDDTATYTCSASLKHYAIPTDDSAGNNWEPYNWLSKIIVYDGATYAATTSPGVELITSKALEVAETVIDFGSSLSPGQDSGTNNKTTEIVNYGNSPLDVNVLGTDMSGNPSGTITANYIEWDLIQNFSWSSGHDLKTSVGDNVETIIPKPTSSASSSDIIYWGIGIPFGSDASAYTGLNTFTSILDTDDWPAP